MERVPSGGAWLTRMTLLGLATVAVIAGAVLIDRYPGGRLTAGVALIVLGAVLAGAGIVLYVLSNVARTVRPSERDREDGPP